MKAGYLLLVALIVLSIFAVPSQGASVQPSPITLRSTNVTDNGTKDVGVKNPGTWPHNPGEVITSDKFKVSADFIYNDYYQHGGAHYPYEYAVSVWRDGNNQRVFLKVSVKGCSCGWNEYFSGEKPIARMYQKKEWVPSEYQLDNQSDGDTGWIKADTWEFSASSSGTYQVYWPANATFSFSTNSNSFRPGLFVIQVKFYIGYWLGGGYWSKALDIYGLFTFGDVNADVKGVYDDTLGKGYTTMDLVVNGGKWHVTFWYVANNTEDAKNLQLSGCSVTSPNTAQLKKDFGIFSKDNPPPRPLQYNYTDTDPAGIYVWLVCSVYNASGNVEVLYSWTATVHNQKPDNMTTEQFYASIPKITVQIFKPGGGNISRNDIVTISIHVDDDNSSALHVLVTSYYSENVYMAPDPATTLVQYFMYPVLIPNHSTKNLTLQVTHAGQLNVMAIVEDEDDGLFNITRTFTEVADFQGAAGGGFDEDSNPWITWPWSSTVNMAILVIGVIMMFSRRSTLMVFGVILFFASFVNWVYVADQISGAFSWLPHEVMPI